MTIYRPQGSRWSLHVCCNHPDNGMFTGFASAFEFGIGRGSFYFGTDFSDDQDLMLTGPDTRFKWIGNDKFLIGRYHFPCTGIKEWFGNWCWDACFVDIDTVRQLRAVLSNKGFTPESGSETLWKWYESFEEKSC